MNIEAKIGLYQMNRSLINGLMITKNVDYLIDKLMNIRVALNQSDIFSLLLLLWNRHFFFYFCFWLWIQ